MSLHVSLNTIYSKPKISDSPKSIEKQMVAYARKDIVDPTRVGTYHVTTRAVRRAFLCGYDKLTGKDYSHRKGWISDRLADLSHIFLVDNGSFAIMDNHLHNLLTIRPDLATLLTDREIIDRWWKLYPRKFKKKYLKFPPDELVEMWLKDRNWLEERRARLCSLSWYMRCLLEPIARRANKEDGVTGRFWEERFKSTEVLGEEGKLAVAMYIDLNPVRAGIAKSVKQCKNTSLEKRLEHVAGKKHSFLARFNTSYDYLKNEAPFLAIDEKDYIALCAWQAERETAEYPRPLKEILSKIGFRKTPLKQMAKIIRSCPRALGPPNEMTQLAVRKNKKWFKGQKESEILFE